MKWPPKKRMLRFILILGLSLGGLLAILSTNWCRENDICSYIRYEDSYIFFTFWLLGGLVIPMLPPLIIIYFLPDNVFATWKKFAVFTTPIVVLFVFLILMGIGRIGNAFFVAADYTVHLLVITYGLFYILSAILIVLALLRRSQSVQQKAYTQIAETNYRNRFTPKQFFYLTLILACIFTAVRYFMQPSDCILGGYCYTGDYIWNYLSIVFWVPVALLPIAVFMYSLPTQVFTKWKGFAAGAIPITFATISILSHGKGYVNQGKEVIILFGVVYGLFFLLSLLIITVSWWRNRGRS